MRDALSEAGHRSPLVRIIGLGSPFGDDRVGWRVIEALRGRLPDSVDLQALDRPGAALINWMADVGHLVLVDALSSGARPGDLVSLDPVDLMAGPGRLSSHELALADTLRVARSLGCLPQRIDIHGIEIGQIDAEALSPAAEAAATRLADRIRQELR